MSTEDPWQAQLQSLGRFIRAQRQLADLSLREMGDLAKISNAYLSQVERGLHQPSVRVLRSIAAALGVPAETLLAQAGLSTTPAASASAARPSAQPGPSPAGGPGSPVAKPGPSAAGGPGRPVAKPGPSAAGGPGSAAAAIAADPALTDEQRQALLAVYRSFVPES